MGHVVNADHQHRLLQQQLDRTVCGAPDSPELMKILHFLFSEEDAELARRLPGSPTSLSDLTAKLAVERNALGDRLDAMARRGLVFDFMLGEEHYYALAPMVIGLFEFTFMRARDDLPMAELARLFEACTAQDDRFVNSLFGRAKEIGGATQIGRALVREETLPGLDHTASDHTVILDWQRASRIVESATAIGVSQCSCRHKAEHLGKACDAPQRCCLSLNYAGESLIRNGFAEPISTDEALRILGQCKEAGLMQIGDNVRRKLTYICNCCSCCCEMIGAIKTHNLRGAVVTSAWIARADEPKCRACGKCVEACPVDAIEIVEEATGQKPRKWAKVEENLCLGCGVCHASCKFGALSMQHRRQQAYTPETVFDRILAMAVERGKLSELLFENHERLSHRALLRIAKVVEHSPFFKAAMAIKPLRSAFLERAVAAAKKKMGPIAETFE
ncbi:MAG TPA: 4Fe-4S binding protein [Thermoguttaceae bacterium]|nr:4Fe-4S binding protein [Thermoguttaceae bacterium]